MVQANHTSMQKNSLSRQSPYLVRIDPIHAVMEPVSDAKTLATPKAVKAGTDVRTLKDNKGEAYGEALYAAAQKPEGRPDSETRPRTIPTR